MNLGLRAEAYTAGQQKIAAFIAGYSGTIENNQGAITGLQASGYDVVAYDYSTSVLAAGEPQYFHDLIKLIEDDFNGRAAAYETRRYSGVSFGSAIGINLQKRAADSIEAGIYGAGGADIAKVVFDSPFFRTHKRTFMGNGYTETTLREAWKDLHEPPLVSFAIALGRLDYLAKYRDVTKRFALWEQAGGKICVITRPTLGHSSLIKWFNRNIPTMLKTADML